MSVCTKGFAYLLCWPRGRGVGLACTRRFWFHEFYNFLPFVFLILIFFWKTFFLPTTFTHTHTHDPRPLPTTHDPRHLATLQFRGCTFHQRSAETNLTLICPSPKLFVCDLPDSGRHVTRPNQGLSTGGRENLGTRLKANLSIFIPNRIGRCRRYTAPT